MTWVIFDILYHNNNVEKFIRSYLKICDCARSMLKYYSANSTFPVGPLIVPGKLTHNSLASSLVPKSQDELQNIISLASTLVSVREPLTFAEKLGFGSSGFPINIPKEFAIGFYSIFLSLLVLAIVRWIYGRRQINYVSKYMTNITSTYDSLHQNKVECEKSLENIR